MVRTASSAAAGAGQSAPRQRRREGATGRIVLVIFGTIQRTLAGAAGFSNDNAGCRRLAANIEGDCFMTATKLIVALALLLSATSIALAQSQRNYGPNGPSNYGCYGSFYTGTVASSCPGTPEGGPWSQYRQYPQSPPYPQYRQQWQWQRLH